VADRTTKKKGTLTNAVPSLSVSKEGSPKTGELFAEQEASFNSPSRKEKD